MSRLVLVALAVASVTSCTSPPASTPSSAPAAPTAAPSSTSAPATPTAAPHARVAVIVMENKEYDRIIGSSEAPYINGLARRWALATDYFAVAHPSLPNYLALIGGDTFGVRSDCTDCYTDAPTIVDGLEAAHIPWKAYMQGMPSKCFAAGSSGRYAKKHNPFMYFDGIRRSPSRCNHVVPYTEFDPARLPTFTWITPDGCNDMHDCSIAVGDAFLRRTVPAILSNLGPRGVLFVTFDEGTSSRRGGGHIVTIAAGDGVKPGRYASDFSHYSLLRTIEDRLGLPFTAKAATAPSMSQMLR